MSLARVIEPEWLDELPAADPRAIRSRRDLRRVNRWMLQASIMARTMRSACGTRKPRTVLELGAGDGSFMLSVARRLAPDWPDVTLLLLDQQNIVSKATRDAFRALGWDAESISADVLAYLQEPHAARADLVTANLFLHHFRDDQIAALFAQTASIGAAFAACEPWRAHSALGASHMLWVIGCNDVSRHDAVVSVRAGFRDSELSQLWPSSTGWELHEGAALPFTHCFAARPVSGRGA
jgi:hypothetical protein